MRTLLLIVIALLMLGANQAFGTDYYYIGNTNWNNGSNWSFASGGPAAASVPGISDRAIFDVNSGNCNIDISFTVAHLETQAGYAGTITQNTFNIVVDSNQIANARGFIMNDGIFAGGSGSIDIYGDLYLAAGVNFTSTSDTLTTYGGSTNCNVGPLFACGNIDILTNSFNHNSGTVEFQNIGVSGRMNYNISTGVTFNVLVLTGDAFLREHYFNGSNFNVADSLIWGGIGNLKIFNGTINVQGDIHVTNNTFQNGSYGTALININGAGDQYFYGGIDLDRAHIPSVTIDKTGGALYLSGYITIAADWTYNQGNIVSQNGHVSFIGYGDITGSHTLSKVHVRSLRAVDERWIMSGPLIVSDSLFLKGQGNVADIYGGEIHAQGDVIITQTALPAGALQVGTATVRFNGLGNQHFYGRAPRSGYMPNITIDKAPGAGTLYIHDTIVVGRHWEYIQGDVDALTYNSNIVFINDGTNIDGEGPGGRMLFNVITVESDRNLRGDVRVADTLVFHSKALILNSNELFIENSNPIGIFEDPVGYIISETGPTPGYGTVTWMIDSAPAGNRYKVPFGRTNGIVVPFTFEVQTPGTPSGGTGSFSVATYPTNWLVSPNNRPLPTGVTNTEYVGVESNTKMIDRYWPMSTSNYSTDPISQLSFSYWDNEWSIATNQVAESLLQVERYDNIADQWLALGGTINTVTNVAIAGGISSYDVFSLVDPSLPDVEFFASDVNLCDGQCITFTDTTEGPPVAWSWTFPGGTPSSSTDSMPVICYNTPGIYDVTLQVEFANGQTNDTTYVDYITVGSSISVSASNDTAICLGESAPLSVSATGAVSYDWTPGATLSDSTSANTVATPTTTTKYYVTATTVDGCTGTDSVTVTVNPLPTVALVPDTTICFGDSATLTATAGFSNYQWNPSVSSTNTATVSPTSTTVYDVIATDVNGCTATDNATVTVNPLPVASISNDTAICEGACVNLTASGGVSYSWSTGAITATINVCPMVTTTYCVTVTDTNGCSQTDSVTVTVNPLPVITTTSDTAICTGGSVTLTASAPGAITYAWNDFNNSGTSSITVSPAVDTTYTVTVTDGNGCSNTASVTVTLNPPASVAINGDSIICQGESTTLTATSGVSWQWNDAANSVTQSITVGPVADTTYTVVATDANGCSATGSKLVTVNTPPVAGISNDTAICFGASVTLTATGGPTYQWNDAANSTTASITVMPGVDTTYTVVVTDANGCTDTAGVGVTVLPLPAANIITPNSAICAGDTLQLNAQGGTGWQFSWTPNTNIITNTDEDPLAHPTITTTYVLNVTDANNCGSASSDSVVITVNPLPVVSIPMNDTTICAGDSIELNGPAGFSAYTWSPNSFLSNEFIRNPISKTPISRTYILEVVDANGCTSSNTDSVRITVSPKPVVNITTPDTAVCDGACVNLTVSGGVTAYWSVPDTGLTVNVCPTATTTYGVVVENAAGCRSNTADSVTVTVNPLPVADITNSDTAICEGACVTLVQAGGIDGIWSTPTNDTTSTLNVCPAITTQYFVTALDANGCQSANTDSITVTVNPLPVADVVTNDTTICAGESVPIDAASGFTTYSWSPGTDLSPGANVEDPTTTPAATITYILTVTDANGCTSTATDSVTITVNPLPIADVVTPDTTICEGDTATIDATSGFSTYSWFPAAGLSATNVEDPDAFPAVTTTYVLTVTDINGCTSSATDSVTVTVNPLPIANVITSDTTICAGDSVTLTASGGNTYQWGDGSTVTSGNPITVAPATTTIYTVVVTDAFGCVGTATDSITVTVNQLPIADVVTNDTTICAGDSVTLDASSGFSTYSWLPTIGLSPNGTVEDPIASPSTTTTYVLSVTDANGCTSTATDSVTVTVNPLPVADVVTPDTTICEGDTVTIDAASGFSTYSWAPAAGLSATNVEDPDAFPAVTTTYVLTVTDINGCISSATDSVTVTVNPLPIANVITNDTTICAGDSVMLTASGGDTYQWDNGSTVTSGNPITVTPTLTTTYTVVVTDAFGCVGTATDSVTVTVNPLPIADAGPDKAICPGESDTLIATGGVSYMWSNSLPSNDTVIVSPLTTTTYVVTITDANGCSATDSVTVSVSTPIIVTAAITDATCNGGNDGTITTNVLGGIPPYNYGWSNNAGNVANLTGLTAGIYTVTVTDAAGCTRNAAFTVGDGTNSLTATVINANCGNSDGAIDLTVSGGSGNYTYQWTAPLPATQDQSNLAAGSYTVTVTDGNTGCVDSLTIVVAHGAGPLVTGVITDASSCSAADGAIDITVSGGSGSYSYSWSPSAVVTEDITNVTAGNYIVTVTDDSSGCQRIASFTVNATGLSFAGSAVTDANCGFSDGSITLSVSGGTAPYVITWSDQSNDTSLNGLDPGTYPVTVVDANGCSDDTVFTVSAIGGPTVTGTVTNVTCNGANDGAIDISVAGGSGIYLYLWSTSETTQDISGLSKGIYTVTSLDITTGCATVSSFEVTEPASISMSADRGNISCFNGSDGSIDLTVTGGTMPYTYSWSSGPVTQDLSNVTAGTYSVTVTDANGCTNNMTIELTQPATPLTTDIFADDVSCFGGNDGVVWVVPSGGTPAYSFAWSGGTPTANGDSVINLIAGNYAVTITDTNNCQIDTSIIVNEPAILNVALDSTNISCFGACDGTATATVTGGNGGYTYAWNIPGANTSFVDSLCPGIYTATVTDAKGCTDSASANITEPPLLGASITDSTNLVCYEQCDGTATVTPNGGLPPYSYLWSDGQTDSTAIGLCADTLYMVTVTDANNCNTVVSVTLSQPPQLIAAITDSSLISCNGACDGSLTVTGSGGTGGYTYLWNDPSATSLPTATGLCARAYTVNITDDNGCVAISNYTLTEPTELQATVDIVSHVSCNGLSDGEATVVPSGGTPSYTIFWSTGDSLPNVTDLSAGSYDVSITDANGCQTVVQVLITQPQPLTLSVVDNQGVSCFDFEDGSAAVLAQGGTTSYTFNWSHGGQELSPDFSEQIGLDAGDYVVTVTDGNGCSASTTLTISEPAETFIIIPEEEITTYLGDEITMDNTAIALSDVTYNWEPPDDLSCSDCLNPVASPAHTTTYVVTMTDSNGCTATDSIRIIIDRVIFYMPNAFSPNGDGQNDIFKIEAEGVEDFNLVIFDRWGEKLFESNESSIGWDGTYKGKLLNPNVYIFHLRIKFRERQYSDLIKGSITLIR